MVVPKSSLGARIKSIRKMRGLSQSQTAELAGIDPKSLSRIESDVFNPAVNTLGSLAAALQIEMYEFFTDEQAFLELSRYRLIAQIVQAPGDVIEDLSRVIYAALKAH